MAALAGLLWWLIGPRVRDGVERIVEHAVTPDLVDVSKRLAAVERALAELLHPVTILELRDVLLAAMRHSSAGERAEYDPPRPRRPMPPQPPTHRRRTREDEP